MRYVAGRIFVFFFLSHHDIFELYITMNDAAGMQEGYDFNYFSENYPRNSFYRLFVVFNPVKKVCPFNIF